MVWVLAQAGAGVLLLARNVSAGEAVVQRIDSAHLKARTTAASLTVWPHPSANDEVMSQLLRAAGRRAESL